MKASLDNMGIWGGGAHSNEEYARLDSLAPCAKQVLTIIAGL